MNGLQIPIVIVGGCPRSGTHLLGNMLGSARAALYFPVELGLNKLLRGKGAEFAPSLQSKIETVADFMRRGVVDGSSNQETHEVRGFDAGLFVQSFQKRFDGTPHAGSILAAYVGALRDCRPPAEIDFVVEKSPQNELVYEELAASGLNIRFLHVIRPLAEVYASWKAKFLREYRDFVHPSFNVSLHIIELWRRSLVCAKRNLQRYGRDRYLVVPFADGVALRGEFVTTLSEFVFPGDVARQRSLTRHLVGLSGGAPLANQSLKLQSNSSFFRHASVVNRGVSVASAQSGGRAAGWEERLCRAYEWFYEDVRDLARSGSSGAASAGRFGKPSSFRKAGLLAAACVRGPSVNVRVPPTERAFFIGRLNAAHTVVESLSWLARHTGKT